MRPFSPQAVGAPVWSAMLPGTASEAFTHLAAAEETLSHVGSGVPRAEERLAEVLQRARLYGQLAFASPASTTQHELELLDALLELRSDDAASFGLPGLKAASEGALAAVARLHEGISARGEVETHVGETLIGRTSVNFIGAERTLLRADCTLAQAELHRRTVSLSVASRIAMITMLAAALRGAARMSAALALPGGPLLLVPSVLRFIAAAARDGEVPLGSMGRAGHVG